MGRDSSLSQKASPTSPITAEDKGLDHRELTTSSVLKVPSHYQVKPHTLFGIINSTIGKYMYCSVAFI